MKNNSKKMGAICASLHFFVVIILVSFILSGNEPDWPMYWMVLVLFDLPILLLSYISSGLLMPIFEIIASQFPSGMPLADPANFWLPLFYFGILGTAMWFFLPSWIVGIINKIKKLITSKRTRMHNSGDKIDFK